MTDSSHVLRREELYAEIWKQPASRLAASYGISGVALAKICSKLRVPRPPRGYWSKKSAGQRVKIPPLPRLRPDDPVEHVIERPTYSSTGGFNQPLRPAQPVAPIEVAEELGQPHALIRGSITKLKKGAKRLYRVARTERCPDVKVGIDSLDRAIRIMNALFHALDDRGLQLEITDPVLPDSFGRSKPSSTRVQVDGEWIAFAIEERTVEVPQEQRRWDTRAGSIPDRYRPSGRLTLRIENAPYGANVRTSWTDGKRQRVEGCLSSFVGSLPRVACLIKARRLEDERRKREWEKEERRRAAARKRAAITSALEEDLQMRIGLLRRAQEVRAFAGAAEAVATPGSTGVVPTGLGRWLAWARLHAGELESRALAGLGEVRLVSSERRWNTPGFTDSEVSQFLEAMALGSQEKPPSRDAVTEQDRRREP